MDIGGGDARDFNRGRQVETRRASNGKTQKSASPAVAGKYDEERCKSGKEGFLETRRVGEGSFDDANSVSNAEWLLAGAWLGARLCGKAQARPGHARSGESPDPESSGLLQRSAGPQSTAPAGLAPGRPPCSIVAPAYVGQSFAPGPSGDERARIREYWSTVLVLRCTPYSAGPGARFADRRSGRWTVTATDGL